MGIVVIFFEVCFVAFTLFFLVHEVKSFKKIRMKYFQDFWNLMEVASISLSIVCMGMYAMKKIFGNVAMTLLHESESGMFPYHCVNDSISQFM